MQYIGLLLSAGLLDTSPMCKLGSSWAYPCQHAAAPPEWGSKFRLSPDNLKKTAWMQFQFPPFNIFNFFTCWILSEGNRALHQTVSPALCLSAFHYTLINRKRLLSFWSSHLRVILSNPHPPPETQDQAEDRFSNCQISGDAWENQLGHISRVKSGWVSPPK